MSAQLVEEVERNDHYIHSVDFSPRGEYIYWTETGKTSTNKYSMGSLRRASLTDLTTSTALNAKGGDVRHTHNGRMLTIGNLATEVYTVSDPDGATPTVSAAITPYIGQGKLLSHMALQPVIITNTVPVKERVLGHKHYELTDHLGNVRAVVSDMKYATWSGTAFEDYHAQVESRADYYAFGSLMPGRHSSTESYRFAFNGKENDDEVHSAPGTSVDFGARMYDSRVGRWLSIDPLAIDWAEVSPYCFALNCPILYIDPDGKSPKVTILSQSFAHKMGVPITSIHELGQTNWDFRIVRDANGTAKSVDFTVFSVLNFAFVGGMYANNNTKTELNKNNPGLYEAVSAHEQTHALHIKKMLEDDSQKYKYNNHEGTIEQVIVSFVKETEKKLIEQINDLKKRGLSSKAFTEQKKKLQDAANAEFHKLSRYLMEEVHKRLDVKYKDQGGEEGATVRETTQELLKSGKKEAAQYQQGKPALIDGKIMN